MFVTANIQSFTSQIVGAVSPLGENLDFFNPVGFDVQFLVTSPKNRALLRSLKRYLNEKNVTHRRVMATISKFSPQIFETYFSLRCKNLTY